MAPRTRTVAGACAEAAVANKEAAAITAASVRGRYDETFMIVPLQVDSDASAREYPVRAGVFRNGGTVTPGGVTFHIRLKQCRCYIGGVRPSRPTLMRSVSNEPSGSGLMKAISLAPAFRSDLSAG